MSKMTLKSKLILVLVLLTAFTLYLYEVKIVDKQGPTQVFEIKNTQGVLNNPEYKTVAIEKHYMITNPPEDLQELKAVVEKFLNDNPIDNEIVLDGDKTRVFQLFFFGSFLFCVDLYT